jgi:hypothetical protein
MVWWWLFDWVLLDYRLDCCLCQLREVKKPGFLNNTFAIEEKCFWLAADVEADVADG